MKRNKILAIPLEIALGLEIIAFRRWGRTASAHRKREIILAPEPTGAEADALAPFATPPENRLVIGLRAPCHQTLRN